jgi:hypothetical protein
MSGRPVVRIGGAIVAGAWIACVWSGFAAGAPKVPDPCTLVPAGTIASTVGVSGAGKLSTRPDNGVKDTLCTIVQGAAKLEISVSPHHGVGGYGGVPGMVLKHIDGLGPNATYAYDLNPKYKFADVTFSNGTFDGDVWNNGSAAPAHVLAVARILYKSLPH